MKTIALIPARYAATRFPGKLMEILGQKTVIRHTYENTKATLLFDEVIVVTDSVVIFDEIIQHGGYALMSTGTHESGSDRIAEAAEKIDVDIIVNVQGDEPLVNRQLLKELLEVFEGRKGKHVQVASVMTPLSGESAVSNPNHVKVVVDNDHNALYFSRSPIPYYRNTDVEPSYYKHIGIYAFRKQALIHFTKWEISPLERMEKLEQLRYLENGIPVKMVITNENPVAIDTPEDLEKARALFAKK
jgi:3-deoxy-manno-octulosonate cytidylyltransferase (CMP-KDO synthetase)